MNKAKYLYKSEPFLKVYEFTSEGLKGSIKKIVQFRDTGTEMFTILHSAIMTKKQNQ
jgi:hypothetical protein